MLQIQSWILTITPFYSPNVGGVETHLDNLSFLIKKERFKHTIITYQPLTTKTKAPLYNKNDTEEIFRIPWIKFNLFYRLEKIHFLQFPYLFTGIFIFSFFYLLFQGKNIKIIHGHGLACAVATFILAKLFRKRSVVSLHTIYKFSEISRRGFSLAEANTIRRVFIKLDNILVLAKGCKDDLIKIGIPAGKIETYVCWVDNKNIFIPLNKHECRNKLGLQQNEFIVMFIGRFSEEKGLGIILESISIIKNNNIKFLLVGDGPMMDKVKYSANQNSNIIIAGSVDNEKLTLYYNSADILLFGSVDQDYYGRVTMEALSCGLPVILPLSTKYFGIERKVTINFPNGEIGFFVEPDSFILSKKILDTCDSKSNLSVMSDKARIYALKYFSESNGNIFLKTYNALLRNNGKT